MKWFRQHPRGTLAIGFGMVLAAQGVILLAELSFNAMMALALGPYAAVAVINGWVLKLHGRTRHWLWLYLFYSWGGALIPLGVALFARGLEQPVDDHVRSLGA